MSKCQGCAGGNAPHNESSKDHIDNMKKLIVPMSGIDKLVSLICENRVAVEFSYKQVYGEARVNGFKIVIDEDE